MYIHILQHVWLLFIIMAILTSENDDNEYYTYFNFNELYFKFKRWLD